MLPGWTIPASQTVHFYEAVLAVLAIVVWHLFNVLLHPAAFPMDWTWITGHMSEEQAREHHPRWLEEPPPEPPPEPPSPPAGGTET